MRQRPDPLLAGERGGVEEKEKEGGGWKESEMM